MKIKLNDSWPLWTGMTIAGTAAVIASAVSLADLATDVGWQSPTPILLPAAVDVGGAVGGWVWLRPGVTPKARDFGRLVALYCAMASLTGNAISHLIQSKMITATWPLTVIVGAVPAAILIALAHLATLLTNPTTATAPTSTDQPKPNPPIRQPTNNQSTDTPKSPAPAKLALAATTASAKPSATIRVDQTPTPLKPATPPTTTHAKKPIADLPPDQQIDYIRHHLPARHDWTIRQWMDDTNMSEGTTRRRIQAAKEKGNQ